MRIVLFDFNVEGHHFTYINLISLALYNQGHNLIIMSPCSDLEKYTLKVDERVEIIPITSCPSKPTTFNFFSTRKYVIQLWKSTAKVLDAKGLNPKEDLIFFPSVDDYITAYIPLRTIEKIFKYNWIGLYIKPRYLRIKQTYSLFRKGIFNINYLLGLKSCKSIAMLDDGVIQKLKIRYPDKRIVFLPDIISEEVPDHSFPEYERIKKDAAGRLIILLIGAIDRRKGLVNLLQAARTMDESKYFFVVAGKIHLNSFSLSEQIFIEEFKNSSNNSCFLSKNIPSEAQFNALISLCDILFAAYLDFPYSSNMIGKAAFFKKPILVSRGYLMQEIIEDYKFGVAIDQNNIVEIVSAIEMLSTLNICNTNFNNYLNDFSWEKFSNNVNLMIDFDR
jgi:glycosyltransferase involved in cell wall biosynthesis